MCERNCEVVNNKSQELKTSSKAYKSLEKNFFLHNQNLTLPHVFKNKVFNKATHVKKLFCHRFFIYSFKNNF